MSLLLNGRRTRVTIHNDEITAWLHSDPGFQRELDRRATRVQHSARRRVGVDTGLLLSTIRKNPGRTARGPHVDIVAGKPGLTPYLWWHHEGTAPHVIRPRRRKALRFVSGGKVIFATKVNHPGTKGTKFLTRALDDAG